MGKKKGISAKEHILLGIMIILAFFILATQQDPEASSSVNPEPTAAAVTDVSAGPLLVLVIIMLVIIVGIIVGLLAWWKWRKVRNPLLPEAEDVIAPAEKKIPIKLDPLTKKLAKVEQELQNVPIKTTAGHIINSVPTGYITPEEPFTTKRRLSWPALPKKHHLLKKRRQAERKATREVHKIAKRLEQHHKRESLQEKMLTIEKEIGRIKIGE